MYQSELYKKSVDGPLLICVSVDNIPKVLFIVHTGWYGSHIGCRSLALKITRTGLFWPTLSNDTIIYEKTCDACQRLSNTSQKLATTLTPVINTIPFVMWGIDMVGKLPKKKGGVEYDVVIVDYFIKWVEAAPLKQTKGDNIVHFLWKHIITRFGIPKVLILDNGPQFEGSVLAEFGEKYGIERRFSPVYYPQANGQVEVMNRIILSGLKKNMVQTRANKRAWTEELPTVVWSLHTTPSHATGETPFALVYGTEVVLPVEVGFPSYRQKGFDEEENNLRMRGELNFTEELRDKALFKMVQYKHLMARTYNRIAKVIGPATYELSHLNGKSINHTWHATKLRKYYV
ncbi:hypothetical protein LIER_35862 [Lithospermum erythrorhizon]|uniref:Integrase catalytic domain-containing protein n=1 Tax=Lithospermum erythrorhizon TaxID=34254 RepID=A0AAV3NZ69_LITER